MVKLTETTIKKCQEEFDLTYHVPYAYRCLQLIGFEDKDVLEVGGSLPEEFVFEYLGARSWTAVETPEYEESLMEAGGLTHKGTVLKGTDDEKSVGYKELFKDRYVFNLANIEDLSKEYYNSFDIIFSVATFEHISKLSIAFDRMYKALKPGGTVFSLFSPIWSSFDGHHLPRLTDKNGEVWCKDKKIIPPWAHLQLTPPGMLQYLKTKTDSDTAALMTYYIYNSSFINRYFFEDYEEFVDATSFREKKIEGIVLFRIVLRNAETSPISVPPKTKIRVQRNSDHPEKMISVSFNKYVIINYESHFL